MTTNGTTTPFPMLPQKALSADILGLGEATHGNLLINAWRVLTIKYLIEKHGFRVLALEDDVEYVERVFHEKLPNTYLAFMFSQPLMTELFDWIRAWNRTHPSSKDQVYVFGMDTQYKHSSSRTPEGKLFREYSKKTWEVDGELRDRYMFEIFEKLYGDKKTIVIAHNGHLQKTATGDDDPSERCDKDVDGDASVVESKTFGQYVNSELSYKKYIVVAHTFARGAFMATYWPPDIKNKIYKIVRAEVNVRDPIYNAKEIKLFRKPPADYIYSGLWAFDLKNPMRYYDKSSSRGFDMVLLINEERMLDIYRDNRFFTHHPWNVVFVNFDPRILPVYANKSVSSTSTTTSKMKMEHLPRFRREIQASSYPSSGHLQELAVSWNYKEVPVNLSYRHHSEVPERLEGRI